jgi:hypothetical protein
VVCTAPETIKVDFPSIEFDLVEGVSRNLQRNSVIIIRPDAVATLMDEHGGFDGDVQVVAEEFDADIIAHVDLNRFEYMKENSPEMFHGRVNGTVTAYEVLESKSGAKRVQQVFVTEYAYEYPKFQPLTVQQMSKRIFLKKLLDRVSLQLSQTLYNYKLRDRVE